MNLSYSFMVRDQGLLLLLISAMRYKHAVKIIIVWLQNFLALLRVAILKYFQKTDRAEWINIDRVIETRF